MTITNTVIADTYACIHPMLCLMPCIHLLSKLSQGPHGDTKSIPSLKVKKIEAERIEETSPKLHKWRES